MASIENSLKYEFEVSPGKVRLVASGEFVRAYNHSAWLFFRIMIAIRCERFLCMKADCENMEMFLKIA